VRGRGVVVASLVGIVVFGAAWEVFVRLSGVQEFILLPPSKIIDELVDNAGTYFDAALVTGWHALAGMMLALVIALVVGAALASSRFLEQAAQPVLVLILVAPWVAYFTSIVTWLGRGDPPVLFLVTLVAVPAYTFAAVTGLRSGDPSARELLASVNASRLEVLWRLRLPSALPALLSTTRYVIGLCLAAAYYGEGGNLTSVAEGGLGTIGRNAVSLNRGRPLWASVFATVLLGVIGLGLVSLIERVALRWHVSQRRSPQETGSARSLRRWVP
jgi:NitT/TauT family transport system permease protein